MTHPSGANGHPDHARVEERAHLLPEEQRAGSDDPERQAEIVLEDSDERTEHPEDGAETSTQTASR
ncbi:MAG: hypothetical protein QOE97_3727 [Pseudonocardiales bacterium]|jgi:hypothetical protein|nr:hypothetical protein [Pseudonocardiales bacterium]